MSKSSTSEGDCNAPCNDERSGTSPSQANGNPDGVVCSACGLLNQPGVGRCAKCQRFVQGNQAAVDTGLYRRQQPFSLRAEAEAIVAGIVADKGGEAELSTLQRAYVGELGQLVMMLRLLVANIAEQGLLSPSQAPRKVFDAYLAGLDRFDRLAQRIGTKREARQLKTNMETFINGSR